MNILQLLSVVFLFVGAGLLFKSITLSRKGSIEACRFYTYTFLVFAGGDLMSAFSHGLTDPSFIDLGLAVFFLVMAYKEWKRYLGYKGEL